MPASAVMRLALVAASNYERAGSLPPLPMAGTDADRIVERLAEPDARFVVEKMSAGPRLFDRIAERCGRRDAEQRGPLLLFIRAHVRLDAQRGLLLDLDARHGERAALSALRRALEQEKKLLCVLDLMHAPDAEDPTLSISVVEAARDALDPDGSGIELLVGAEPATRLSSSRRSPLVDAWMAALDGLRRDVARLGSVTSDAVVATMRADSERFHRLVAVGHFLGQKPFPLLLSGRQSDEPAAAESVTPAVLRAAAAPVAPVAPVRDDAESVTAAGDAHAAGRRHEPALGEYKRALLMLGTGRAPERAELYVKMAEQKRGLGSATEAGHFLDKALAAEPLHGAAFSTITGLLREQRDFAGLDRVITRRAGAAKSDVDRRSLWRDLARLWVLDAGEPRRAQPAVDRWLTLTPDDVEALELSVTVWDALGRHASAVAARRRLAAALGDAQRRGAVLAEAARIAQSHLPNKDEAINAAREALDADPGALSALEVAAPLLAGKRRWKELVALYESVLDRTREPAVAWDLAKKLGLLHRDELDDAEASLRAFERAIEHDPGDLELYFWLAELHQALGAHDRALEVFRRGAFHAAQRPDVFRRVLWLCERTADPDGAWRAATALDALGEADVNEGLLASAHRPDGLLAPRGSFANVPDAWAKLAPPRDAELDELLRTVARSAVDARVRLLRTEGRLAAPSPADRIDTAGTSTLARSIAWAARLLDVEAPALYLADDVPGAIAPLAAERPTLVASRALASGSTPPTLAFLAARALSFHGPDQRMVVAFPTLRDLASLLVAALSLGGSADTEPGSLDGEVAALASAIDASLDDDERSTLRELVERFDGRRSKSRLATWLDAAHRTAHRAGLLVTGDLALSRSLTERHPLGLAAADVDADLVGWWVGGAHGELRSGVGIGLE